MRYYSALLFDLARAGRDGARVQPQDQDLQIPAMVNPIVVLQKEQSERVITSGIATVIQGESFLATNDITNLASQPAVTQVTCTFSKGLWDVRINWSVMSDFTQQQPASQILLGDPDQERGFIASMFKLPNLHQVLELYRRWMFTEDGWHIALNVGATGVGQSIEAQIAVSASKLL